MVPLVDGHSLRQNGGRPLGNPRAARRAPLGAGGANRRRLHCVIVGRAVGPLVHCRDLLHRRERALADLQEAGDGRWHVDDVVSKDRLVGLPVVFVAGE
eukprot:3402206-Alexandrium_andersonii.AAC.1